MKIIKRDGRIVDYDRQKISIAIEKANNEVKEKYKASNEDIKKIILYIEDLDRKRMLVEDIQDIIEQKLMEIGKYQLAKKYIVYRYTRALVRKQNTTDESILGLIRNENINFNDNNLGENTLLTATQRDYIAGEVSKDLTKRLLLPEKIVQADLDGVLHFHDSEYFIQPMFNCCLINISDMLDNGTIINNKTIDTPNSFQVACIVMTQIIATVASNQYGNQSVDLSHLGKYLRKSYNKYKTDIKNKYEKKLSEDIIEELVQDRLKQELKSGIQTIQYQINTLLTTNGHPPFVSLFLNLDLNDPYIKENAMIFEEILKQRYDGIKNDAGTYATPEFPKLVYVLDEHNCLNGGKYDYLTLLAIKCSKKTSCINYISAKKMRESYENNIFSPMGYNHFLCPYKDKNGNYKFEGRFNQGLVSINLPQIAIIADGDENTFWKLLDERLELCKEALMCRHYALLGTLADLSPIIWKNGAISRLKQGEKIDKLLYDGYSTLSLGYVGIYEMTKLLKGVSHTSKEGYKFAQKVLEHLNKTIKIWQKETNIGFTLYGDSSKKLCNKFVKIDRQKFGTIKDITDKDYYTNSYHINKNENLNTLDILSLESNFQKLSLGGCISYIENYDIDSFEDIIKFIYDNIIYTTF